MIRDLFGRIAAMSALHHRRLHQGRTSHPGGRGAVVRRQSLVLSVRDIDGNRVPPRQVPGQVAMW